MGFTNIFSNSFHIIMEKEFFIPEESNIFQFKPTKMNDGSGDWWLYGEDSKYYYALNQNSQIPKYFKFSKENKTEGFDKFNYKTWNVEN